MKYINNIKSLLFGSLLLFVCGASITSCTDWLDKEKDAIVPDDETFKNFVNFQGYVEEIYNLIPDKQKVNYCTSWNFGDDAVHNPEGYAHMDHQVDLGNYRNVWNNNQCWINGDRSSLWKNAWYCIRKCNMGIAKIDNLVGSEEERKLLLGQMHFFRAWWHFELMCYFGGLPYIDKAFDDGAIDLLPRLSFQKCAERCAEDFTAAYNYLPLDWDATIAGERYENGKNQLRINRFMALCYLGKCYLWAGSPLMKEFEKESNGGSAVLLHASENGKTYDYDENYCKLAAKYLGEALDMVAKGSVDYELADFNYSSLYDHEYEEGASPYCEIFYTHKDNWKMPGGNEAIFRGAFPGANSANWNCTKLFGPKIAGLVEHDNIIHHPTANLIDQYGTSDGEPIYLVENGVLVRNPDSEWDPEYPYKNRDPRFYHDIVFDGFHYVHAIENLNETQKNHEYCTLYTNGAMRSVDNGSSTGYFIQKLVPHQCNVGDKWYEWDHALQTYIPYMRLADVYLMYAEAQAAIAKTESDLVDAPTYCMSNSAVDAVNAIRNRVNTDEYPLKKVPKKYYQGTYRGKTAKQNFIDVVRRERAVELAFEGFRWCDLQRWLLLTEAPYTVKYSHEFERMQNDAWFKTNDPKDAKVANFKSKELIRRDLGAKHYWFPLPDKDVYLNAGFKQNPGW